MAEFDADKQVCRILTALSGVRLAPALPEEAQIHEALAEAFRRSDLPAKHEAVIAPRCRVDFLCGCVGVEVKKGKTPTARLVGQCARYLASPLLEALIVVSPRALTLPKTIGGKPVYACSLNRFWGVALH